MRAFRIVALAALVAVVGGTLSASQAPALAQSNSSSTRDENAAALGLQPRQPKSSEASAKQDGSVSAVVQTSADRGSAAALAVAQQRGLIIASGKIRVVLESTKQALGTV